MRKNTKRFLSTIAIAAAMSLAAPIATAQDEAAESESEDRVLDTVEVVGVQNDAAMAAFRAGDFETAEIEFLDNAMCALRRERNVRASVDTAQINSQRAEVFTNSTTTDSGASSQGANAGAGQTTPTGVAATDGVAVRNLRNTYDRTCDAKAKQLYFAGLSQIQLGKTNEALRSFEKATASSRILYDAHYKIGLIKLLTGDTRKAESELRKMEGILERCRDCEAKQEIVDRIDHLSKAINGEVSLQ
jgi:tetratricopeptide (TPR) repeat protein